MAAARSDDVAKYSFSFLLTEGILFICSLFLMCVLALRKINFFFLSFFFRSMIIVYYISCLCKHIRWLINYYSDNQVRLFFVQFEYRVNQRLVFLLLFLAVCFGFKPEKKKLDKFSIRSHSPFSFSFSIS
jgi:hypothetical protein